MNRRLYIVMQLRETSWVPDRRPSGVELKGALEMLQVRNPRYVSPTLSRVRRGGEQGSVLNQSRTTALKSCKVSSAAVR